MTSTMPARADAVAEDEVAAVPGISRLREPESGPTLSELAGRTAHDVGALMRAELALAKAELRQELTRGVKGAGALMVFLSVAVLGSILIAFGACWALALVLPTGAAFAIVGAGLVAVGLPLVPYAVHKLRQVQPLPETQATLSEVATWNRPPNS